MKRERKLDVIEFVYTIAAVILASVVVSADALAAEYTGASAYSGSSSQSGSVAISPNTVEIHQPNDSSTEINSASAYAPNVLINPTAPCRVGIGGSGGWIAGSFGIGGSYEDEECSAREAYRLGIASPDADIRAAAKAVFMNLEAVKKLGDRAAYKHEVAPSPRPTAAGVAAVEPVAPVVFVAPKSREETCMADGGFMDESRYDGEPFCRRPKRS